MRLTAITVAFAAFAFLVGIAGTTTGAPKPTDEKQQQRIAQLVRQLDAKDFDVREKAEKALIKIGKPAVAALRKATKSTSAEVQIRATRILLAVGADSRRFQYVQLQGKANQKLVASFHGMEGNHLGKLDQGESLFGGVKFKVGKKFIQLASSRAPGFPEKVEAIPVGRTAARVHFLHATGWGSPATVADGTRIGSYVVRYADKTTVSIPIDYGVDVRDWWNWDESKKCKRGKIVWRGSNPAADKYKKTDAIRLRLYLGSWKNPHPKKKIVSIDYTSTNKTICAPFCVAISVELAEATTPAKK